MARMDIDDAEDELEYMYSNWLAGLPPTLDEVMGAIGRYLESA
jgi:hypothetical protein